MKYYGCDPFDQKFRFEFSKFSCVERNGIFHSTEPVTSKWPVCHSSTISSKQTISILQNNNEIIITRDEPRIKFGSIVLMRSMCSMCSMGSMWFDVVRCVR